MRPPTRLRLLVGMLALLLTTGANVSGPQPPDNALREAAALIESGETERAEVAIAAFLSGRDGDPLARHQAGALWLVGGDPARAAPHFRAALQAAPDLVDARLGLGQALGQLGAVEEALAELGAVAEAAPDRYEAPYLAAAILDSAGRISEAVAQAADAVAAAPREAFLRRFLGRLLLRIEHWPEAQDELEEALRLGYRDDPAIFADLGAALVGQEQLAAARAAYENHRALAPDNAETLLQLGYLDWRTGDHEASEGWLEQAIALDPGLRRAHHFLGLTALRRLDLAAAEAAFRRALETGEDFPEAWFHLGKIALRRGEAEEAARLLQTAIEHAPDYREAYYQLAFALRRLGDQRAAAAALARFEALGREGASDGESRPREEP